MRWCALFARAERRSSYFIAALTTSPDIVGKFARIGEALPHLRLVSFGTGDSVDDVTDLESIAAGQSPFRWDASALEDAGNRLVALFHTGGTTGAPEARAAHRIDV